MEISTDDLSSLLPECDQLADIYCAMHKQFSYRMSKISLFLSKIDDIRELCGSGCKWLNKESISRRENYGSMDWSSFSNHNETLGTIERNVTVILKNRIVWIRKFVDKVGDTQDELEKLYNKISDLAVSELENEGNKLSDLYKEFYIEKVKYLKLIPAKIPAPHAKATYFQPRRVTRSSGSSDLSLFLDPKDNIYSDAYSNQPRSVEVDLSSPDRCEGADDSYGENKFSDSKKKKLFGATTSAVQYLTNDSDSDDNVTTVSTSTHSQPTRKQTGLLAERNRERLREESLSKAVAPPSEPDLQYLPLPLQTSEMNDSSTPEEWVAASSEDSHLPLHVKFTESGEAIEKRDDDVDETAVRHGLAHHDGSISSGTFANSDSTNTSLEPLPLSLCSVQSAAVSYHHDPPPATAIPASKPVRKTPLPSGPCSSVESVAAKDVLSQSVSPSKDKHSSSSSSSSSNTASSSSSSSSSSISSSRKRSASDLAEGNVIHTNTSTRAAARKKDETDDALTNGSNGSSMQREKRPRQVKEKGSLVDLTEETGDREFT